MKYPYSCNRCPYYACCDSCMDSKDCIFYKPVKVSVTFLDKIKNFFKKIISK